MLRTDAALEPRGADVARLQPGAACPCGTTFSEPHRAYAACSHSRATDACNTAFSERHRACVPQYAQGRGNRKTTAKDKGRTAYFGANIPNCLWVYSVIFACTVINVVPNSDIFMDVVNAFMFKVLANRDAQLRRGQEEAAVTEAQHAEHDDAAEPVDSGDELARY